MDGQAARVDDVFVFVINFDKFLSDLAQARPDVILGPFRFLNCLLYVGLNVVSNLRMHMARVARRIRRVRWTKADCRKLKAHSRARTPVAKISKEMKRTVGALRQQAFKLNVGLGHQR